MTKDEALKMAIDVLPELISTAQSEYESQAKAYDGYPNMAYRYLYLKDIADDGTKSLNACKEALDTEQVREDLPAQEPVYLPIEITEKGFTFNCEPLFYAKIIGKFRIKLERAE